MARNSFDVRTDFGPGRIAGSIWGLVSVLTFGVFYASWQAMHNNQITIGEFWLYTLFTLPFGLAAAYAGNWASRRHRQHEQHKRDMRAERILEAAHVHKAPDFSLFLRAFETTGKMPKKQTEELVAYGFDPRFDEDQIADFEKLLAEAVEKFIPLVALGRPGEQIGAGRVTVADDRWKEEMVALANASLVIFLFPSIQPSTLWETDWLIQHALLKKTIFVMPPQKSDAQAYDWRGVWTKLAPAMSSRGIQFPEYDNNGKLFALGNDLRISIGTNLLLGTDRTALSSLRRDINKQLMGMAKYASSSSAKKTTTTASR